MLGITPYNAEIAKQVYTWVKRLLIGILILFGVTFLLILLVLEVPAVQQYAAQQAVDYAQKELSIPIKLQKINVDFPDAISLEGLYLADQQADTLLYCQKLHANIALFKLLGNTVEVEELIADKLVLNINRKEAKSDFNYQFLIDEFVNDTTNQTQDTTSSPWEFSAELLQLKEIAITYEDDSTGFNQYLTWANFSANLQTFDLESNKIRIDEINLQDAISKTELSLDNNESTEEKTVSSSEEVSLQTGWDIAVEKLQLNNNRIIYTNKAYPDTVNGFDANHLDFSDFNLEINDIVFNDSLLKVAMKQFTFREKSGLTINNIATNISLKEQERASIENFKLNTPYSQIALDLSFRYPNLNDLINLDNQSSLALNLHELKPGFKDLSLFMESQSLADYSNMLDSLNVKGVLHGSPKGDLFLENLNVYVNKETQLAFQGRFHDLINTEKLSFSIQLDTLLTTNNSINNFVPDLVSPQLILPNRISANGSFKGSIDNVDAAVKLVSDYGNVELRALWQNDSLQTGNLSGDLALAPFSLGKLLPGFHLGNASAILDYAVSIPANEEIGIQSKLSIDTIEYNGNNFTDLNFDANYQNDVLALQGTANNEILGFNINLKAELKEQQKHELQLQLHRANLVQLGLSDSITGVSTEIHSIATLSDIDDLNATLNINALEFIRANKPSKLDKLYFELYQEKDSLLFKSKSEILDALLLSNLNLSEVSSEVLGFFDKYVELGELASDSVSNDYLSLKLQTYDSPIWQELIVPGLSYTSPISLSLLYGQSLNQMEIDLQADSINYNGFIVDEIDFALQADRDEFNMKFTTDKIMSGPVAIYESLVGISIESDTVYSSILLKDSVGQSDFLINTQLSKQDSSFYLHINGDSLLLSGESWSVSPDNYVAITENNVTVNDFIISNQEQQLSINSIEDKQDSLLIGFEEFNLNNFLRTIGITEKDIAGTLEGNIILSQLFTDFQFDTDLQIDSIDLYEVPIGNLSIQANNETFEKYSFNVSLKGMHNDMEMNGNILVEEDTKLDVSAAINAIDLKMFEGLSSGAISEVEGYLEGDLAIKGRIDDPIVTGNLGFVNSAFLVSYLNTTFSLDSQRIVFEPASINFDNLQIKDINENEATINGKIIKNSLTDYSLDLKLKASNFKPLETKRGDNELFYGKVRVNSEIDVTGNILSPTIDMQVELLEGSDITYIVPEDELLIEEQKGIIEFIQITANDTLVMSNDTLSDNSLTGFDLNMNLDINKDTKFTVLIDEAAGDKLEIEGDGELVFDLQRNGIMTLTGRYNVIDGFYVLTFYGLVKKRFTLAEGSNVVWRGDPYNAALSIQAIYETRTSPQTLMVNSGNDGSQFTRPEVFQVLMNIRGDLTKPQIGFELDIPEDIRSDASVYNTVKLLNQNEAELNKQVFSLLVLNSFIATNSSNQDIGDNFISSTARTSVSQLLTQQLNNLSEKLIKGVQLDLNLESYGSGSQAGTDLQVGISKSLLNDRVSLEVGGSYQLEGELQTGESNLVGNVAIEYKITEDGRYRLRFYQMNDNNILDGQVISTGLSVIFTRDYDKLKHLFKKKEVEEK